MAVFFFSKHAPHAPLSHEDAPAYRRYRERLDEIWTTTTHDSQGFCLRLPAHSERTEETPPKNFVEKLFCTA